MSELIAMQDNLGLGHKGDILLTTQKRIDNNQEPIAKNIIHRDFAVDIVRRWNAFEKDGLVDELRVACGIGLESMRGLMAIGIETGASNQAKRKHEEHIKFVEAAITKVS